MIECPGVEFDIDHSMIVLNGTPFPCCAAEIPMCDDRPSGVCQRCTVLGGCLSGGSGHTNDVDWSQSWEVFIPAENGVLFLLGYEQLAPFYGGGMGLSLTSLSPVAERDRDDTASWIFGYVCLRDGAWHSGDPLRSKGEWNWLPCEPEWLAETLPRWARLPCELLPGDRVKLLPISDPRIRPREHA